MLLLIKESSLYDDDTLEFIANNNSYGTLNISATAPNSNGSGTEKLAKIKVPDDFNIGADTGSSLTNDEWSDGVISATDTCVGQPKLIIHRVKFMSGGYFKSANGFLASAPTASDYHSDVTTFWNDYDDSSTNANTSIIEAMIILLVLLMKLRIKITLDGLCMNTLLQILVLVLGLV